MVNYLSPQQGAVRVRINKPVYLMGETVKGAVDIKIKGADLQAGYLSVKMLMELLGIEKVNQLDQSNNYFRNKRCFYKKKKRISYFGNPLPQMCVRKYFQIQLPQEIPSFTINQYRDVQCRILYILSVYFETKDGLQIIKPRKSHRITIFTIMNEDLSIPSPISTSAKISQLKLCCFNKGSSELIVNMPRSKYQIGEDIHLEILVDNSECSLNIIGFTISVQSQLQVQYKKLAQCVYSYFKLGELKITETVNKLSHKVVNAIFPLKQQDESIGIYPQSTISTQRIKYQYNICIVAQYSMSKYQIKLILPIEVYQLNRRNDQQQKQQKSNYSIMPSATSFKSQFDDEMLIYGDHDVEGYGVQDGYKGVPKADENHLSLDSVQLRDIDIQKGQKYALNSNKVRIQQDDEMDSDEEFGNNQSVNISQNNMTVREEQQFNDDI